ncbi:hypothetical protein [Nitrobacter sp. TKz-YC02]|uniref:hypothetical protein n=1 Tax=Nitrobacter sp. TKz-YC02 TaxID=3398704 RepID=UPI003CEFF443
MTDNVPNELLLKTLQDIHAKLNDMAKDLSEVKNDMRGLQAHVASCIDRIERRLDLTEG